ncbi:2Fe-2S iron-sulfur cluster-binding protein [Spirosoma radiotolerans]|uniref:Ferredoxin n=1 Tax=Spirosoma radiotolerans TaxID=1379870 RepID=A0A0E3V845_9BACT|nr:2Fe-2S iron-sulfur cluster-binding protein [Spirosoma radiotolerans]AKD56432.1 ferredoxin [Spirosoma radiotolerans]
MITFTVEDRDGEQKPVEVPEGISLSLMEVLKASDYNILATCGGMALCATCHVQVVNGFDNLPPAQDLELDMLDTLPDADSDSRLACQIRVDEAVEGALFRIKSEEPS